MQATEDWVRDDLSHVLLLVRLRWLARDVLVDALVGSGVIEVGLILLHCLMEMALAQYEEEVEAFAPHIAKESLANGVALGRLIGHG